MFRLFLKISNSVLFLMLWAIQLFGGVLPTKQMVNWSDSLLMVSNFQIQNGETDEALSGAVLKLSDPLRHGVVFSYVSDEHGYIRFEIELDQTYFIQIDRKGFERMEFKIQSRELAAMKTFRLKREVPSKNFNFVREINQLTNFVSIDVFSPLETHLCWLYPSKQNSRQIVGFSHNTLNRVLTFSCLSY